MGKVQDKDLGYRKIIKNLVHLGGKSVVAGVLADAGKEADGTDLVDIAVYNEFGVPGHIPPRPFVRIASDKNERSWNDLTDTLVGRVVAGSMGAGQALDLLGVKAEGDIKKVMGDRSLLAPNDPATVKLKGSDAPLIDTGRLRQSVKYRIE